MLEQCNISGFADEIHKDFQVQLNVINELGQKYIELRSADGIGISDFTCEMAVQYQNKMRNKGIMVSSVGSPIGKISITDDFTAHFEMFRHIVAIAELLEVSYIRIFSFFIPKEQNPEKFRNEVFLRLQKMVDYARDHHVILLHENEKDIYGDNKERCKDLMDHFYGEHFKCVFDFANFVQCREDTSDAFEMLKPFIFYIHIKDALKSTGEVVLPGDGDGNVKMLLNKLDQMGFTGFLSLEPHLADFNGLEKLELSLRNKREEDGISAYKQAYIRLRDLLA